MNPGIDWLRASMRRWLGRQLVLTAATAGTLTFASVAPSLATPTAIALALVAAAAGVVARLMHSLVANPLGMRYFRDYLAASPHFVSVHDATETSGRDDELVTAHFTRVEVVATDDDRGGEGVTALYADPSGLMIGALDCAGTLTLLTRLGKDCVLVTSPMVLPPSSALVVNAVPRGNDRELIRSHEHLVKGVLAPYTGLTPAVCLLEMAARAEHEAYSELGPFWSSLLDLRCRLHPIRLLRAPHVVELFVASGPVVVPRT